MLQSNRQRRLSPQVLKITSIICALAATYGSSLLSRAGHAQSIRNPIRVASPTDEQQEGAGTALPFKSDYEFMLVQSQPPTIAEAQPEPPARTTSSVRRRRRTYELPPMFGDLFGGGSYQATILPTPVTITQSLTDGQAGIDLFVRNLNGGAGADPNPAVGIVIQNSADNDAVIANSIGPGIGGTGQAISFPISEPILAGISPPATPGPGTVNYGGGTATYAGTGNAVGDGDNWRLDFSHDFTPTRMLVNIPSAGAVGRGRIAENNSPEPRARYFWNYNYYNDVIGGIGEVNRHTFGLEQPLWGGGASVELRIPFAGTLDTDQVVGGVTARNTHFGDVMGIFKAILTETEDNLISVGLGITAPTADDANVFSATGAPIMSLDHQSVRIMPFLGAMRGYESGWYWQSFLQFDLAASGDPLAMDLTGGDLQNIGVLQEPHLLYYDIGVGRWITGGPGDESLAIAATAELHYATTLQDADLINTAELTVTNVVNRYDLLNLTMGLNIAINRRISIRPAFVLPLHDRQFDAEAMVQANVR